MRGLCVLIVVYFRYSTVLRFFVVDATMFDEEKVRSDDIMKEFRIICIHFRYKLITCVYITFSRQTIQKILLEYIS